jgi:hypothetical protein
MPLCLLRFALRFVVLLLLFVGPNTTANGLPIIHNPLTLSFLSGFYGGVFPRCFFRFLIRKLDVDRQYCMFIEVCGSVVKSGWCLQKIMGMGSALWVLCGIIAGTSIIVWSRFVSVLIMVIFNLCSGRCSWRILLSAVVAAEGSTTNARRAIEYFV